MSEEGCAIWPEFEASWGVGARDAGDGSRLDNVSSERAGGPYSISLADLLTVRSLDAGAKARLTTWLIDQRRQGVARPIVTQEAIANARSERSLSVDKRAERLLRYLKEQSRSLGERLMVSRTPLLAWTESTDVGELLSLESYLEQRDWITGRTISGPEWLTATVTVDGHRHVEEAISPTDIVALNEDTSGGSQVPWGEGPVRAFLSHQSEYKPQAVDLKERLQHYGIAAFVAHEDITPTLEWQTVLRRALQDMHFIVPLVTASFVGSAWANQEVGYALARAVPVVPVRLGSDPPGFIGGIQCVPGVGKTGDQLAHTILETMLLRPGTLRDLGREAFITAVSVSRSWEHSNVLARLIPRLDTLSSSQVDRLVRAFNSNREVHYAHRFNPELARHLTRITGDRYEIRSDQPPTIAKFAATPS